MPTNNPLFSLSIEPDIQGNVNIADTSLALRGEEIKYSAISMYLKYQGVLHISF